MIHGRLRKAISLSSYSRWIRKRYGQILFFSLITTIVGLYYSIELYKNLRTDLEELLPESAESVRDLKAALHRVSNLNHLSIVMVSNDHNASLRFVKDLSERLRNLPKDIAGRVEDNIISEKAFFEKNKTLYIDLEDWENIEKYIRYRFRAERIYKYKNSLLRNSNTLDELKNINLDEILSKYNKNKSDLDRFEDGYFLSRDKTMRVVLVRLPGKVTDVKNSERLSVEAHRIVNELNPKSYASDLQVGFDGDVQNLVEEHHAVIEDLISSGVIVSILVAVSMFLFFKKIFPTLALGISLICGTAWTFGTSFWVVGYLNANTAFLGSIVLGNGINFGIIFLARYLEERERKIPYALALSRSIAHTGESTWAAAAAAGISYLSLVVTDFRGFNQFGIIGGLGMLLCWLSTFTTFPALIVWIERKKLLKFNKIVSRKKINLNAAIVEKFYKPIVVLMFISAVVASFYVGKLMKNSVEMDLTKLRSKDSLESGSGYWGKKVDAIFEQYLTPTLILANDSKQAEDIYEKLNEIKIKDGKSTPIDSVKMIDSYLPKDQTKKLKIMENIRLLLPEKVLSRLPEKDQKMFKEFMPQEPLRRIEYTDLPELIQLPFKEADGRIGRIVHVYPKFENGEFWDGNEVIKFTERMRTAIRNSGANAFIAGQAPISADMLKAIKTDGPKATALSFLGVFILVLIIYQNFSASRSVTAALCLGVLWMIGLMGAFKLKVNFLNFIALPITFGIGVDYVVNIYSRYIQTGKKSIVSVLHHTGSAVALCSLSTIIGYGSLIIASNQAFVSFGVLAIIGEITCLLAAVIALPSFWKWFEVLNKNKTKRNTNKRAELRNLR